VKLATRMWLLGAVLPVAGTAVAVAAGGWLFRASLEQHVDTALATQASSERAGLFDSSEGRPHVHADASGMGEVARFTTSVSLYGPDGRLFTSLPPRVQPPDEPLVVPGVPGAPPVFVTRHDGQHDRRERVLRLTAAKVPTEPYVLEIVASLDHVDRAVRAFYRVTLGIALLLALVLFTVHGLQARRLAARVSSLARHMARLREGRLDADAPLDPTRDEIGALSGVVAEATARLREARAAQERLIADAAHELRTPLTLVRTSVDVALRRERPAEHLQEVLVDVRDEVDRLARLATRILDVAAAGQGSWDRAPGDLAELTLEAVEACRPAAEARGLIVEVRAEGPVPAIFHAGGVRQAVDNLLANALRFAPERSTVLVRAWSLPGGGAAVSVHDDGPGIPEQERERLFEPFWKAGPGAGAGLGLAIVSEIARKHGGRAYAAPVAGRGTTIVLELGGEPLRAAAGRAPSAPRLAETPPA
jgi:signal transduction histidine kinase